MSHYKRLRTSDLKKPLAKKCKVPREILTFSFNKKNQKKYYQHYADDPKNTTIDFVNDDCLAEIFMRVAACERPKIALVCKKWRKILKKTWSNVSKLELTYWQCDRRPSSLKNHRIRVLRGHDWRHPLFYFTRSLFDKCGFYLTELDVTTYSDWNIVPAINESCYNVVKLRLRLMYCHNIPSWNEFSYLTKLKVLKVIFQTDDPYTSSDLSTALSDSLINVAGTLTELSLSNWIRGSNHCDEITRDLTEVIPELKALKTIEIFGMAIDPSLSMYLRNSKILAINFDSPLSKYIFKPNIFEGKNGKTLTKLDLTSCQVSNDFLYNIANCMENVKILKVSCERVTDIGIVAISKIKFLQHLYLSGHSHVTDSSIKLLKKLKILHLPNSNKITNDSVTKILVNSPQMKELRIVESAITADFIKHAEEITRNRKKKLKLEVSFIPDIKQYQSPYLDIIQNPPKKNK